jgi:hypothetical protein
LLKLVFGGRPRLVVGHLRKKVIEIHLLCLVVEIRLIVLDAVELLLESAIDAERFEFICHVTQVILQSFEAGLVLPLDPRHLSNVVKSIRHA